MSANLNITIIGAGIVGVSTAIWLQRDGHNVTLLDKSGVAAGTSYGNAGILASAAVVPVTVPGLLMKAPKMLFDRNQPLFLRWSYLPRLIPFLFRYLKNGSAAANAKIAAGLTEMMHDSPDQHLALANGTGAEKYIDTTDYFYGYKDQQSFNSDAYGWNIRKHHGYDFSELNADELSAFDPSLAGRFGHGVRLTNHGRITDPGAYVNALADHFVAQGGKIETAEVTGFEIKIGKCTGLQTTNGTLKADRFVVTTGAWSKELATALGVSIPFESERGYHIEYVNPSITLRAPIMVAAGKFVVNSMDGRMRAAGVVEFGGLDAPASRAPFELLKRQMAELFPDLTYDRIDEWMGHRPSTSDSLPVIGAAPNADNVFLGYGHQHIGLTGGPKTGRWLAKLAAGAPINTDLSPYAADRKG
ncbi:MAG: FAD-binding oxidoreductase [Paracoccaceae bacterium]|nr:FAD-binding oxidoreductase [Paracoccaceae bacterium]